jgi:large exoprotein involved in heme utilization and adhesion
VVVRAGTLSVSGGAQISASTQSSGTGGNVEVTIASATALRGGAQITAGTAGPGAGGNVKVTAQGALTLTDQGTGITASTTSNSSGNAGSVTVTAPQITVTSGGQIASTTAGTGAGGSVSVTTPGALMLDGMGIALTQIAASASGLQSGPGGAVTVAANSLSVASGARIAATTAGPGKGGDIAVTVANGVTLSGTGPASPSAITASADAGSSGRAGEVVLTAGGAIAITTGLFIKSPDSIVPASSELGISGTVEIIGPRVDFNGLLVVLPGDLRTAAAVLRNSCAAQSERPQSSLVEAGRGGQPQDPDATLPALYIAGRDLKPALSPAGGPPQPVRAQPTTARLTMHCDRKP